MAGERTLPGLGLVGGWDLGDNTFKTGMDTNLRTLSALVQPFVLSVVASAPGAPTAGDIHIASSAWGGGSANDIMLYDEVINETNDGAAGWIALTPEEGWKVWDRATDRELIFTGSAWVPAHEPTYVVESGTTFALADSHLDGRTIIELSNAGSITFTVTASLTRRGPVTVINTGGGDIAFVNDTGVTTNKANTNLKAQWTSVTIFPKGSDVFHIIGNLEAA